MMGRTRSRVGGATLVEAWSLRAARGKPSWGQWSKDECAPTALRSAMSGCMCGAANFYDRGICRKCGSRPSQVHRAVVAGNCQRVRHMPSQAGALHVKAETETVVTEDEVSSKDGLTTRDGAPGYRARSIIDGTDLESETSGRSIAGSAAGLGFGKPGAIQGGGPGRAKRSPSSARDGPGGHDQATDCDRGCQRGKRSRDSKKCPTTWRSLWPSANRTASTPMNAARRAVLQAHVVPCCLIAKNNSTSTSTSSNPSAHCPGIAGAPHDSVLVVTDADWAGDVKDRQSHYGITVWVKGSTEDTWYPVHAFFQETEPGMFELG